MNKFYEIAKHIDVLVLFHLLLIASAYGIVSVVIHTIQLVTNSIKKRKGKRNPIRSKLKYSDNMGGRGISSAVCHIRKGCEAVKAISIDIETFAEVNLQKTGVYRYAESEDFGILLFGYAVDGGHVKVVDLAMGEEIPKVILDALTDDRVIKWAFNAQFERICLSLYLQNIGVFFEGKYLNSESWHCTMVWAATLGLPLYLEGVGLYLALRNKKWQKEKALLDTSSYLVCQLK